MKARDRRKARKKRGQSTREGPRVSRSRKGKGGIRLFGRKPEFPKEGLSAPRMVFAGVSALSLFLLGMAVFRSGGILEILRLSEQVRTMRHEMEALSTNNRALNLEIRGLQQNPQEVERIAREVLGLVRPGEKVYEFIEGE